MTITRQQVFDACKIIAPIYKFEVTLIQALCMQEGGKDKNGNYLPSRARLEPGFYLHYIEKQNWETTNEVLYSASYGVTQMLGESLREVGFFDWWFNQQSAEMKIFLGRPLSEIAVPKAINWYCDNLNAQIEWGCKWLSRKRDLAHGDIVLMLSYWNGDSSSEHKYANEVLTKQKGLT